MIYLTTREVADLLHRPFTASIRMLIRNGSLPCARRTRYQNSNRINYWLTPDEVEGYLRVYDPGVLPAFQALMRKKRSAHECDDEGPMPDA